MSDLRKIIIDGQEVEVEGAMTLLQACEVADVEIPRFCYHERLTIAGNCRMCLVEVVGGPPKPAASCAMQVRDVRGGRNGELPEIKTTSPMVKKAREGVMEFLLINHPLDCPICDQGGECDLQDQAMAYGVDFSRFREPKRAVDNLDLGPLVETTMTRCISCTRCVRFTTEVAGITQMGQTGRGEDAEITSYLNETLDSELQGNIIDLCPVGALTSKPYAFTARPWELMKTETIDVMDALGSNIRVDTKGREVMRILPRNHDDINEEWISDKARFVWDGLRRQRLDQPYVRKNGKLKPVSWDEAFSAINKAIDGKKIAAIAGDLVSVEAMFALNKMIKDLGGNSECRVDDAKLPAGNRAAYVGTAKIEDIDNAEAIYLIGTNPRTEAPVLNARIRKSYMNGADIKLIGNQVDLTYKYKHIGNDRKSFDLLSSNEEINSLTKKNSLIIIGQGALLDADGEAVLAAAQNFAKNTNSKLLILHTAAARVGGMDIGFITKGGINVALKDAEVVFNLGADELRISDTPFVVYQGSHGDRGAHRANVILPSAAYTEESGIFVNTEGRVQMAERAGFPPGQAKENWAILRALSAVLNVKLPFDSLNSLRAELYKEFPEMNNFDQVRVNSGKDLKQKALGKATFKYAISDHYLTNPIARASEVMAELSKNTKERAALAVAAE
ncbi:NADH-quinone oxidoreductase subunit NuoG [Amylibacter sp.]|nr:NADH-quinone oxidoreductase subunit NuoG [Amylibacter sp.]MDC1243220.1 NADH-quinone oxidoreductase subunit NuoG [Amylibacter sp.]